MKITTKIYVLFGLFSLAMISGMVGITFYFTRALLIEEQYTAYNNLAEIVGKRLDQFLYRRMARVRIFSEYPVIVDSLTRFPRTSLAGVAERISEYKRFDPDISAIYIIKNDKTVVTSSESGAGGGPAPDSLIQDRILEKVFSGSEAYSDVFISDAISGPTIIFAAPIFDAEKNVLGAAEIYVNWKSALDLLEDGNVDHIHLLNKDELEIGSNDPDDYEDILVNDYSKHPDYQEISQKNSADSGKVRITEDLHGGFQSVMAHVHLSGHADFKGNEWILILEQSVELALGSINREVAILALYAFILLLAFYFSFLLLIKRYVIDPVLKFSDMAIRISKGEWNLRFPISSGGRIDDLARALNILLDNSQELHTNLEVKVREKTAQLAEELRSKEFQEEVLEKNKSATLNLLEDISVEKSRADALVAELNKFQLAVENAYEHIIITDPEGVIIYANKSAERITGYTRGEIIGNKPSLWGKQMPKEFYEKMWKTIKTDKKVFIGELKNRRKSGFIYDVDTQITPIIDKDGNLKFFVAIERDITDQKKLEDARTNFISVASHQLRTPLTSIKWIAELILSGDTGPIPEKQKEFIEDLYISSNRMIELVNSLLNIARIESTELRVKPEQVNISELYSGLFKEFESMLFEKEQSMTISIEGGASEIYTDQRLLYEILKNIISNSIKYTKKGGMIKVTASKSGGDLLISVRDNGIGIPKEQQSKMFGKFFRGDNAVKINTDGTGLGMYIVKNLVELLNGKIWFESEENIGSVFHISLPEDGPREREGSKSLLSTK